MKTVIPYMDKMNRIASLNLSPKVPVSLIILQLIDLLSGKRNLQNRVAKWRANLTDENRKKGSTIIWL